MSQVQRFLRSLPGRLVILAVFALALIAVAVFALAGSGESDDGTAPLDDADSQVVEIRESGALVDRGGAGEALAAAEAAVGFRPLFPGVLPGEGFRLSAVDYTTTASAPAASVSLTFESDTAVLTVHQGPRDPLTPSGCTAVEAPAPGLDACERRQVLDNGESRDLYWAGFEDRSLLVLVAGTDTPDSDAVFAMIASMFPD